MNQKQWFQIRERLFGLHTTQQQSMDALMMRMARACKGRMGRGGRGRRTNADECILSSLTCLLLVHQRCSWLFPPIGFLLRCSIPAAGDNSCSLLFQDQDLMRKIFGLMAATSHTKY